VHSRSVLGHLGEWRVSWIVQLLQIRARRVRRGLGRALLVLKGKDMVVVVLVVEQWVVIPHCDFL